jgi:hypothetical protein
MCITHLVCLDAAWLACYLASRHVLPLDTSQKKPNVLSCLPLYAHKCRAYTPGSAPTADPVHAAAEGATPSPVETVCHFQAFLTVAQACTGCPTCPSDFLNISTPVTVVFRTGLKPTTSMSSPGLMMPVWMASAHVPEHQSAGSNIQLPRCHVIYFTVMVGADSTCSSPKPCQCKHLPPLQLAPVRALLRNLAPAAPHETTHPPCSILPVTTVPRPAMLNTSSMGIWNGRSRLRLGSGM